MKRSALRASAVVVLVPALFLGGCGSSAKKSSGTPTSTSTPTSSSTPDPTAGFVALTGDGFSIKLPDKTTPTEQTFNTKVGKVKATIYTDARATDAYVVAMNAYPAGAKVDLSGAVNGVVSNFAGKADVDRTIQFLGHPARQVRISGTTQGTAVTVYLLAIDVDGKLFQLQYLLKGTAPATAPDELNQVAGTITFP